MITITGTVGASGKYLVTGMPVDTQLHAVFKIPFENKTSGTNLGLFAGTDADFASKRAESSYQAPAVRASNSCDHRYPRAFRQIIFVRREPGSANSVFSLTVE
jgi:hypothetical protein